MKILPFGVAVIEDDTHISKWVEQHRKLAIAEKLLAPFRKYVPAGSTVIDIGANIGDHTITYANWVGPEGCVIAFEPNQEAYDCLTYNMRHLPHVWRYSVGLSDSDGSASICRSENVGASHLDGSGGSIELKTLDSFQLDVSKRISFMKIDIEGFETRALRGAVKTIADHKPVMLIEVNAGALERAGTSSNELCGLVDSLGYNASIVDPRQLWSDPQFDVICTPRT